MKRNILKDKELYEEALKAKSQHQQAIALYEKGDIKGHIAAYQTYLNTLYNIQKKPNADKYIENLAKEIAGSLALIANRYVLINNFEEASKWYDKALQETKGKDASLIGSQAINFYRRQMHDKAEELARKFINLVGRRNDEPQEETYSSCVLILAHAAYSVKKYEEAIELVQHTLKTMPKEKLDKNKIIQARYFWAMSLVQLCSNPFKAATREEKIKFQLAAKNLETLINMPEIVGHKNEATIIYDYACLLDQVEDIKNPTEAVNMYKRAALLKQPNAMQNLAYKY